MLKLTLSCCMKCSSTEMVVNIIVLHVDKSASKESN